MTRIDHPSPAANASIAAHHLWWSGQDLRAHPLRGHERGKNYSIPNNGHLRQFNTAGQVVRYDPLTDTPQMTRMARAE